MHHGHRRHSTDRGARRGAAARRLLCPSSSPRIWLSPYACRTPSCFTPFVNSPSSANQATTSESTGLGIKDDSGVEGRVPHGAVRLGGRRRGEKISQIGLEETRLRSVGAIGDAPSLDAHGEHDFARAAGYVPDSANNATSTCRCSDYCPCRRATVRVAAVAALAGLDYLCGSPRLGSNDRLVQRKEIAERSLLPMGPIPSCTDLFFINENH